MEPSSCEVDTSLPFLSGFDSGAGSGCSVVGESVVGELTSSAQEVLLVSGFEIRSAKEPPVEAASDILGSTESESSGGSKDQRQFAVGTGCAFSVSLGIWTQRMEVARRKYAGG